jgi:hypothetical protein
MKKRFLTFILLPVLIIITIVGCKPKMTNDYEKQIKFYNDHSVNFYSYKDTYSMFSSIRKYSVENDVFLIPFDGVSINVLVIDSNKYYQDLNVSTVNYLYDLLKSNIQLTIVFVDAPNLNFLVSTKFDEYNRGFEVPQYVERFTNIKNDYPFQSGYGFYSEDQENMLERATLSSVKNPINNYYKK